MMGIPRNADARRYYRAGKQRLAEAELILSRVQLPAASIYLAGYGVECLLKALLVERTPPGARPALLGRMKGDFGHSLPRLRAGILSPGVAVPVDVSSELAFLARWSPELRYDPGPGDTANAGRFLTAAKRVVT